MNELELRNIILKEDNSVFKVSYNLIADDIKKTEILKNKGNLNSKKIKKIFKYKLLFN